MDCSGALRGNFFVIRFLVAFFTEEFFIVTIVIGSKYTF